MVLRKISSLFLFLMLSLLTITFADNKVVAVFPFECEAGSYRSRRIASGMGNLLENYLVQLGTFRVVERGKLDEIIQEYKLGMAGMLKPETAKEVGKLLGADYLVFGRIEHTEYDYRSGNLINLLVTARVVDVGTGEICYSVSDEVNRLNASNLPRQAALDLAYKITSEVTGRTIVLPISLRWKRYGSVFLSGAALAVLSLPPFEGIWAYSLGLDPYWDESTIKAYMTVGMFIGIGTAGYALYKIYLNPDKYQPNELLGDIIIDHDSGWMSSMPEIPDKDDLLEVKVLNWRF